MCHQEIPCILAHMLIWHNYVSICLLCTHCNKQFDQEHWYTFNIISIYSWTNMPAKFYCSLHIDPTLPHVSIKKQTATFNFLPSYGNICASNKYACQMQYIHHMPKILNVHQWERCANIYGHMNSMAPTLSPQALYTDNPDSYDNDDNNADPPNWIGCVGQCPNQATS